MKIILTTIVVFALALLCLAIGFIIKGKCIRPGCEARKDLPSPDGEKQTCPRCNREVE